MTIDPNSFQFQAPVPGMSLTTELRDRPWERPAQYSTPEEALQFYITQLADPERTSQMLGLLDNGYPVTSLIDVMLVGGTMQGLHSLDTAIIIAPALFDLITGVADSIDLQYEDGLRNKAKMADPTLISKAMKRPQAQDLTDTIEEKDIARIEEVAMGLMARSRETTEEEEE